jgi:hypothetical protein
LLEGTLPAAGEGEFTKLDEAIAVKLMFTEINRLRADEGVPLLALDTNLSVLCREHSRDMAEGGYFSHINPDGLDANDRVRHAGLNCLVTENIGVYRTDDIPLGNIISDLMASLYESELHRENMLNPQVTHVGIGFYQDIDGAPDIFDDNHSEQNGGYGVVFVTQNFYRREISKSEPSKLPAEVNTGQEVKLSIRTVNHFDSLSLHFERDGFFTEEYLVQVKPKRSKEYSCKVRFAERGRWACQVVGVYDPVRGLARGIGQMEFVVQ